MNKPRLDGPAFLIAVGILLGSALGATMLAVFADVPGHWAAGDQRNDWLGFWGSIGGGLLGGLFTVAAAIIAVRPVVQQLTEIKKQTAAATRMALANLPTELTDEMEVLDRLYQPVNTIALCQHRWTSNTIADHLELRDQINAAIDEIVEHREQFYRFEDRYGDSHRTSHTRRALAVATIKYQETSGRFAQYVDAIVSPADEKPILSDEAAGRLHRQFLETYEGFHIAMAGHRVSLNAATAAAWRTIRKLEAAVAATD